MEIQFRGQSRGIQARYTKMPNGVPGLLKQEECKQEKREND